MEKLGENQQIVLEACYDIVREDGIDSIIIMQGQYDFVARRTELGPDQVKYAMGELSKKGLLIFDDGSSYPGKGWYMTPEAKKHLDGLLIQCPHCAGTAGIQYLRTVREQVEINWEGTDTQAEKLIKVYERNDTGRCLDCDKRVNLEETGL